MKMDETARDSVIRTYIELFTRGEILKARDFIFTCVPLWLKNDELIGSLRQEVGKLVDDIEYWQINGREYPGTHVTVPFDSFEKFTMARDIIQEKKPSPANILDIGCYSGVFVKGMAELGYACTGVDVHKQLLDILNGEDIGKVNLKYEFGTAESIPTEDHVFDVVTAFDVLEHTIDFDMALREIDRVCAPGGLVIINLPRMTKDYTDDAFEHLRMFDDEMINIIWGNRKDFVFTTNCKDELGRETSFISYTN